MSLVTLGTQSSLRRLRKPVWDAGHPRLSVLWRLKTWMAGTSPAMTRRIRLLRSQQMACSAYRAIAEGGGASGAALTDWPLGGIAAGGAAAVAAVEGGLPGSTTTRVPTFTRV